MQLVRVLTFPLAWKAAPLRRPVPASWAFYAHVEDPATLTKIDPHFSAFPANPASETWSEKARRLGTKAAEKAQSEWDELQNAPHGSLKKRVHQGFEKLLEKIDPMENFFKGIPITANQVHIQFPEDAEQLVVESELSETIKLANAQHQKMMYVWGAAVPATALMTVLPGPNVFLAWNAFRLYSHYRALQGARRLRHLRNQAAVVWCPSLELARLLATDLDRQLAARQLEDEVRPATGLLRGQPKALDIWLGDETLHQLELLMRAPHLAALCLRLKHRRAALSSDTSASASASAAAPASAADSTAAPNAAPTGTRCQTHSHPPA